MAPALGATLGALAADEMRGSAGLAVLVAAWGFGVIGLADDVRGVPALARLAVQPLPAAIGAVLLVQGSSLPPLAAVVVVLWVVSYVNAFNFMDGINGIAAAQVLVAGTTWYLLGSTPELATAAMSGGVIASAALGFAPFNFPIARMFLGDFGSYFFGAWLSMTAVLAWVEGLPFEAVAGPLALPMADVGCTLVQRIRRGETWYEAHRDHTYQRLTRLGWSHARTTTVVLCLMSACALLGAAATADAVVVRAAGDLGIVLVTGLYLCGPSLVARRSAESIT